MAYGDLESGAGIDEALRGADAVIHLAGVTKALHTDDYYSGNVRATEQLAHAMAGRGIRLVHVSSLAAIGPVDSRRSLFRKMPSPSRSRTTANRSSRRSVWYAISRPDAVIVRPPVVYGPRDTDVFQLLKSISKGLVLEIAGGERWFSAIYVKDLVEGLMARCPRARCSGSAAISWPTPNQCRGGSSGPSAANIMRRSRAW